VTNEVKRFCDIADLLDDGVNLVLQAKPTIGPVTSRSVSDQIRGEYPAPPTEGLSKRFPLTAIARTTVHTHNNRTMIDIDFVVHCSASSRFRLLARFEVSAYHGQ
jgi:hypothetical protein